VGEELRLKVDTPNIKAMTDEEVGEISDVEDSGGGYYRVTKENGDHFFIREPGKRVIDSRRRDMKAKTTGQVEELQYNETGTKEEHERILEMLETGDIMESTKTRWTTSTNTYRDFLSLDGKTSVKRMPPQTAVIWRLLGPQKRVFANDSKVSHQSNRNAGSYRYKQSVFWARWNEEHGHVCSTCGEPLDEADLGRRPNIAHDPDYRGPYGYNDIDQPGVARALCRTCHVIETNQNLIDALASGQITRDDVYPLVVEYGA
jgi:hypothetical protein